MTTAHTLSIADVNWDAAGLAPAIIQEVGTKQVLMLGYMDEEALRRTLTEGRVTFWSRSRREYWRKGDTSGHAQFVRGAQLDCDCDTILITVLQVGAACHTGSHTCFDDRPLPHHAAAGNSDPGTFAYEDSAPSSAEFGTGE